MEPSIIGGWTGLPRYRYNITGYFTYHTKGWAKSRYPTPPETVVASGIRADTTPSRYQAMFFEPVGCLGSYTPLLAWPSETAEWLSLARELSRFLGMNASFPWVHDGVFLQ
jgi:hypothetical protein